MHTDVQTAKPETTTAEVVPMSAKPKKVARPAGPPFTIVFPDAGALAAQLARVALTVEKRTTIPILEYVKIEVRNPRKRDEHGIRGATAVLTGTDLDQAITAELPVAIDGPGAPNGAMVVRAHDLLAFAKGMGKTEPVGLNSFGQLSAAGSRVLLAPGEEIQVGNFPLFGVTGWERPHVMPAASLSAVLDAVAFAISTEETRYYLNGICLRVGLDQPGDWLAVATDGHRLSRRRFQAKGQWPAPEGKRLEELHWSDYGPMIVPRSAVHAMRKILAKATDNVTWSVACGGFDNRAQDMRPSRFRLQAQCPEGPVVLATRLIDGTFPDYERCIPTGNDKAFRVATKPFAATLTRAGKIATDRIRAVKLSIAGGRLTVSFVTSAGVNFSEAVPLLAADENLPDIGFNAGYLLDLCRQGEELEFRVSDAASPVIVTFPGNDAQLMVLMPLRVA